MPYFVGNSVFMWIDGSLVDASGTEICTVDLVSESSGPSWRVSWLDGLSESYPSEPDARNGIESALLARQAELRRRGG
jgi:hypothetical protein